MNDGKQYVFQFNLDNSALNSAANKIETKLSEAMRNGMALDRSGKAEVKQSLSQIFGIAEEQAETLRKAMQGIVSMKPEGVADLKNQLKETLDFVSGIMTQMKKVNASTDWMKQGIGFVDSFKTLQTALENTQTIVSGLETSVGELKSSFQGFADAFKANDPSAYFKKFGDGVDSVVSKMEGRLKRAKQSINSLIQSGDISPGDFSDYSVDELNREYKVLIQTLADLDAKMSNAKAGTKEYRSYLLESADALADLQEINKLLPKNSSQGMNTVAADVVATIKQAGEDLKNTVTNLKLDNIKLSVELPDVNAAEFNAQIDNFVQQATQKFQGKPIEVSVDLINPFKDAKSDTLPVEHEKKARELAEKFINAYNEAISQKDGADKKAKETIDISGQLSALYDPSVSSVLMKFWDSWNKIYDSVKAGQTTLLEATKNWKQKMTEELKLKFVWFNEDAAEGVSDLFERINQMAEKNPVYLVPQEDYLIGEIEKVLSNHRFSLNVDLGDAKIPISVMGGSGGSGGASSGGAQSTLPTQQLPSQTPPTSNSVPDVSGELAETVDEMQDFAYTAESIGEVVTRLSDNISNISAKIRMLSADIDDLDLDKASDDKVVQEGKDKKKKDISDITARLAEYEQQKKEHEAAYEVAKKAEQDARAKLNAEKARRDQASQALRAERDTLFADNKTGQHTDRILALNAQIKELEAPFESGISALEDAYNVAHTKLLTIANSIRITGDNIIAANNTIENLKGTEVIKSKRKALDDRQKELAAEKSKQAAFQAILDNGGNPVSLITDRLITFWESTDRTIESSRNKMEKLAPKLFAMEKELKELQYELDNTDEEQDKDKHSALQERIDAIQNKIAEAEKTIDQKALVTYKKAKKDANSASIKQNWMRAMGLGDIRDLGTDEALEVITSVLQHYPSLAASLNSAASGQVNLKGLNSVKQLISFIPDVQSILGVVATTASESNEELLLKDTFVNLFRIADQLNALDGLVDKKTGEVAVEALGGFITAFEKMPQMATVVQKAKALQKSTDELSDVLNNNDQFKQAFDVGEAKKYLTESFYDLWKALPDTVRGNFHHKTLNLDKMSSVDKADDFVRVVYDEFVRAFSAGKLSEFNIDSPEWQSLVGLLKQGAVYAHHEKATKGLKDSVVGSDGIKRSLYELLHSTDPIHVRVVGRDGVEHDYGVQDRNKAKMDVEHTYGQTPHSLNRAANRFRITDLLTEKFTIEKGIDAEIFQLESELVELDQRISKLDKEADKRQIERLSTLRDTKQNKLNHLKELSATEDGRRQYEKESARRIRVIDEEIFGKVTLSTKQKAPKRTARRDYEYGNDPTIDKVATEKDKLEKEKARLEKEIADIDKKESKTDRDDISRANKVARLQEVESLLAVDHAQKMAIESVRELDKDIATNTARWKEASSHAQEYTRRLEALADAERKKNVLKDTKDDTFNKMSRSIKQGHDANTGKSSTDYTFQVAKQYGTMDQQLVEELEAKVAERNQLIEELETIPISQRYGKDKNGKEGYTGRALELATRIKELRIEIAKKYSESDGSYLTNLLTEQLEQIDIAYDKQEADVVAQSDVKSSDYKTQVDAATEAHHENVAKINATIDTQQSYYANLIGQAQQEADRITEEWQEKVRQLNVAETKMPQYMVDEQTKNIKHVIGDLERAEVAPYNARLQETFDADERKELEAKIKAIQQKYARMLNEQLKPILDEATRIDREVQAKDKELKTYYYNQAQTDERVLALREERKTATPQRTQEIAAEIGQIELEYTRKYQEEITKFKEDLVRGFRKQMEEEARRVEEEGRKNAAQVLANAQTEAVAIYNKSESNTGKKVRAYTSIERELEAQRKAALKAEDDSYRSALAQIAQVDQGQIAQDLQTKLAELNAEREAAIRAAVDRFKANGAYKTDETLITEHVTTSKDAAEKTSQALEEQLQQRRNMRRQLMDEYHLTEEMVAAQEKVAKSDAKRVKAKKKSAQSSDAESNTPTAPKSPTPSGGGQPGGGGGNYGGVTINTSGLAQETTLRGIWELLNGGAPANGWGDEGLASGIKEEVDLSVKSFSGKLSTFADGVATVANSIKNLPDEHMALFGEAGRIDEYLGGKENEIGSAQVKNFLNRHKAENLQLALHNHPDGIAALSPQDIQQVINTKKLFGLGALGSVAGSTITGIDISDVDNDTANKLLNQYKENIRKSEIADLFDDDFDIKEEFANSPNLNKQALSDALNRLLQDAIRSVKLPVDEIYGQVDVSQLDEASRSVATPVDAKRARVAEIEADMTKRLTRDAAITKEWETVANNYFRDTRLDPTKLPDLDKLSEAYNTWVDDNRGPGVGNQHAKLPVLDWHKQLAQGSDIEKALFQMLRFPEQYGGHIIPPEKIEGTNYSTRADYYPSVPVANGVSFAGSINTHGGGHYGFGGLVPVIVDADDKAIDGNDETYRSQASFKNGAETLSRFVGMSESEIMQLPMFQQALADYQKQFEVDNGIGRIFGLKKATEIPDFIATARPVVKTLKGLEAEDEKNQDKLVELGEERSALLQQIEAEEQARKANAEAIATEAAEQEKLTQVQEESQQVVEQTPVQDEVAKHAVETFEDSDGQLSLFDGVSSSAQNATENVEVLENALSRVEALDDQVSIDDYVADQAKLEAEKLQPTVQQEAITPDEVVPDVTEELTAIKEELATEQQITAEQEKQQAVVEQTATVDEVSDAKEELAVEQQITEEQAKQKDVAEQTVAEDVVAPVQQPVEPVPTATAADIVEQTVPIDPVDVPVEPVVEASHSVTESAITQEEIDKYYADHTAKFKTVQKKNGKVGYADDKFSSRVGQALLNSNVLNKDDSAFVQADAKRLQTAYDQIQQALAQEASQALGEDVIAFLQKLQGEIAQKLQTNGYGLEKVDTSPSSLIKDSVINKENVDKAQTYLGGLSGDEYKGSGSVETGLKWVNSVLSSTKQKLNQEDILKLGNGYERLMRAVQSGLVSKFDEDTQTLINEAIKVSQQVLEQYDAKVVGSDSLLGQEITEANKALVKNGAVGKVVTDMTDPAIMIGGKLKQKASASMQKQKGTEPSVPQSAEEGKVTKAQIEQEELTRKTAENKEKQAKAAQEVAEAERKAVEPKATPKPEPVATPIYSADGPQPTGGGGLPGLANTLSQLLNIVAKDSSLQQILSTLGNGIKSTGSGGSGFGNGGKKESLNLSADDALEKLTAQINADYPGAVRTGSLRANSKGYSVDFWRDSVEAQKEAEKIQEEINKLEAEGKANTEAYNNLIQQRNSLLQKQEKITLSINKDTGKITSKVGIENFAVGANAAEKELQHTQGVLAQLQDTGSLQFNSDGSLTSQNQSINNWIQSMQALQVQRDKFASEGTLFDSKNQKVLSQMTTQTAQYRKEIMALLNEESKFGGDVVDTFANPQALAGQDELYQKLLNIATATDQVDMNTVKFDTSSNTLSYTIEKGKNQVQDMTLHMSALSGAVTQQAGEIRHVDTAWQKFGKSVGAKLQEVGRYLLSFGSVYQIWGILKQGVGHIQEIDNALTELKKVTNQTDAEYAKFLKTMSKTASVVGSTVKELTSSAADWARLNI